MGLTRNYDNILTVAQMPNIGFKYYDDKSDSPEERDFMANDQLYLLDQNGIDYCRNYYTGTSLFNNLVLQNNGTNLKFHSYNGTYELPQWLSHSPQSNLEFGYSLDLEDYNDYKMDVYGDAYATVVNHWVEHKKYNLENDSWSYNYRKRYRILQPMTITEIGIFRAAYKCSEALGKVLLYRKRLITEGEIQQMLEEGTISQGDIDSGKIKPEAIVFTTEDVGKSFDITFTATTDAHPHFTTSIALVEEEEIE